MDDMTDMDLLRQYADRQSESAFAGLVSRHMNLVYSAAFRKTGNSQAAEEITQAVFVILAEKAGRIPAKAILPGWLYQTARLTAASYLKSEARRIRREQETYMQSELDTTAPDETWKQLAPLLEDAMGQLGENERAAVLLRFFGDKSFAEVATTSGITENAAKKRVHHALEKLHRYFSRRGVKSTIAVIAGAISTNSVQAAPTALAKSVTAMAAAKGATASSSTLNLVKGALKIMAWTKAKIAIGIGAGILLAVGAATTVMSQSQVHGKEMVGIGISYMKDERSGTMMILNVAPKSPAAQAGLPLHHVMIIQKINAIPVASKPMVEWKKVLDGPVGTKIRLELIIDPKGKETKTVELVSGKYPASDDQIVLKGK